MSALLHVPVQSCLPCDLSLFFFLDKGFSSCFIHNAKDGRGWGGGSVYGYKTLHRRFYKTHMLR